MKTNKKNTLSESELKDLKKKSFEILSNARRALLLRYPFIGSLLMRMDIVPVRDLRVRTACTDGTKVYFDIDFLGSLTNEEQIFVLGHEVYHCVLSHLVRLQSRDPQLFNIATDKEVNNLLRQDGLTPPANLLFPEGDEIGKNAEMIYELLLKKMKKQAKKSNSGDKNDGSSNGSSSYGNSSSSGNGDSSSSKTKKLSGQFDRHQYRNQEDQAKDGTGNGEEGSDSSNVVTDKWGEVGFDKDYSPSIPKDFADKMREAVISSAQQVERQQGHLPAHIASIVKGLMKSEIKWQELLAQFVTKCIGSGRKWLPPNRRYVYKNAYLPSRRSEKIKGTVVFDTSGSCQGDLKKFLTELVGLVNSFGDYELNIIMADAAVDSCEHYDSSENPLVVDGDGSVEWVFSGGGGTSFKPAFDYILDNGIETDFVIYLTDGFGDCYSKNPLGIPTLWLLTKDGSKDFCNWGEKIRFQDDYDRSYDL